MLRSRWWWPLGAAEWAAVVLGVVLAFPAAASLAPLSALETHLEPPGTVILDADGGVLERYVARG